MTAGRLYQASTKGIEKARRALRYYSLTQEALAERELNITPQIVDNFFKGELINHNYFYQICRRLNLEWDEVVAQRESEAQDASIAIDTLVQEVREKVQASIVMCCGMMRVLDMTQPMGLNDIYTVVNILEKVALTRHREVTDLLLARGATEFNRFELNRTSETRVPGSKAALKYSKLMILGKPGAGKTTFLKYLAIQCSLGEFQATLVPIFITLKDFAEARKQPSLLGYITQMLHDYGLENTQTGAIEEGLCLLLEYGRILILLDGLDEVRVEDSRRVLKQIREFSNKYPANQFIITCRIAAREYTLEKFTEVEVADFDAQQIATFVTKWFATKDAVKGNRLIQKLKENQPIQELATSPLLLTMLCLVFEESVDFPANRADLYQEGLNILLKKWDAKRNIEREHVYKQLSVQHKEDMLSQIALTTFEQGDYFFKQEEVEQYISDYICNLPNVSPELEALQLDSKAVLKSIQAQHGLLVERALGIFSFSHLTFQEYFAAREIVSSSDPQALETALRRLVSHMTENQWREVFLLAASLLRTADYLLQLMKQAIDELAERDSQLQAFLSWVSQKSRAVSAPNKPVFVRAFYLDLALGLTLAIDRTLALTLTLDRNLTLALTLDRGIDLDRAVDRTLALILDRTRNLDRALALTLELDNELNPIHTLTGILTRALNRVRVLESESEGKVKGAPLSEALQHLKEQLPNPDENKQRVEAWWKTNGQAWTEQLRSVTIQHRNIGHDWQFNEQQMEVLRQYYFANELLVDCLNSDCYVTCEVRSQIEDTLLLPVSPTFED